MSSHLECTRVAMYSHDTFGLGHITRTIRIAEGVMQAFPKASLLIISGSPVAHYLRFPPRVDYLKLPSMVKLGPERYVARELDVSRRSIWRLRSKLILDTLDLFRPHLLMVDNVPLGMKGELLPALERLRDNHSATQIHLNLRDILDDHEIIRRAWKERGIYQALSNFYDSIHVFGACSVYDAVNAYELPSLKTAFMGYIGAPWQVNRGSEMLPPSTAGRARILVTIGGGGDGEEILFAVGKLQRSLGSGTPYQFHVMTGPLMDRQTRAGLVSHLHGVEGISIHEYMQHLPSCMSQCDLVLCMGGYNTLCEVMSHARRCVVVPRNRHRVEQEIRARALESLGILRVLPFDNLSPESLDFILRSTLDNGPELSSSVRPPLNGIFNLRQDLKQIFCAKTGSARKSLNCKSGCIPHPDLSYCQGWRANHKDHDIA